MYVYHVHAMQFNGANVNHWDGLVTRAFPVTDHHEYMECKAMLVSVAYPDVTDPARVVISSMTLLHRTSAGKRQRVGGRRETRNA